jgi:hypothetical protein
VISFPVQEITGLGQLPAPTLPRPLIPVYWATIPVTESSIPVTESSVPVTGENWTHIPPESVAHYSPESVAHFDRNTHT